MKWLLEQDTYAKLKQAYSKQAALPIAAAGAFDSVIVTETNTRTMTINVNGVLTKQPDLISLVFGGGNTTYAQLNSALISADENPDIEDIILDIDSPGGQVSGLFETLDVIKALKTPIKAVVSNMAASAAFAIASQTQSITAKNEAAQIGSVGVVTTILVDEDAVTITSTNAPDKAPDVKTEEGRAVVQKELDALENLFIDKIAQGRYTTSSNVIANFGRGAVFLANQALDAGMIDGINSNVFNLKTMESSTMDLNEFRSTHSDIFSQAVQEGANQERDRVNAHLVMGENSGDMKTAVEAIRDGLSMTLELQAKYMSAAMNKKAVATRSEDSDVAAVVDTVSKDNALDGMDERVMQALEAKRSL